uniref:Uncharacterized protein n=1 Tax=Tetraselmis sp. GSL018 TaxID=582737 RepID=A0A061R7Z8_9CHLO|mmetsp:Transcript_41587/g.98586  ORF Transcript_41587/g.98586 Transcript_41587/m.98586 type:complete len:320 (-) Transcript_41587:413-1372(-)
MGGVNARVPGRVVDAVELLADLLAAGLGVADLPVASLWAVHAAHVAVRPLVDLGAGLADLRHPQRLIRLLVPHRGVGPLGDGVAEKRAVLLPVADVELDDVVVVGVVGGQLKGRHVPVLAPVLPPHVGHRHDRQGGRHRRAVPPLDVDRDLEPEAALVVVVEHARAVGEAVAAGEEREPRLGLALLVARVVVDHGQAPAPHVVAEDRPPVVDLGDLDDERLVPAVAEEEAECLRPRGAVVGVLVVGRLARGEGPLLGVWVVEVVVGNRLPRPAVHPAGRELRPLWMASAVGAVACVEGVHAYQVVWEWLSITSSADWEL